MVKTDAVRPPLARTQIEDGDCWIGRRERNPATPRLVARDAFRGHRLALPHLVADPAHRIAERAPSDLCGDDLRNLGESRLDGIGMAVAAVSSQELRQGGTVGHRQGGDTSVVDWITQVRTPLLSGDLGCAAASRQQRVSETR